MNDTLFFTADEQALFTRLTSVTPADITVSEETSTAYETDEQLEIRAQIASFKDEPAAKGLAEAIAAGKDASEWPDVPSEYLPELYFTIGARGLTAMIAVLLERATDEEDVRMLSALTTLRHEILANNESASDDSPMSL